MLSPGEQARTPSTKSRRTWLLVGLFVAFAVLLLSRNSHFREYRLYFTEDRKPASLDLSALSEEWTEGSLKERFAGYPVSCHPYQGPLPVQRACGVDVSSTNGVPTLYMSFFFANGRLDQVSVNIPWWSHRTAFQHLVATLGPPLASQFLPRRGVRLHGWRLGNGAGVFFNRDGPINPLHWNAIYWRSVSACKQEGCFID